MNSTKKSLSLKGMEICPMCNHGRFLNCLAKDRFFCMSCLNEFKVSGKKTYLIEIDEETGSSNPILVG